MKKFLAILLAVSLMLAVAACAPTNQGGDKPEKVTAKVLEYDLTEEKYAFGVDKNQPELLAQVNTFIKKIKDNGTLESIMGKYFGGNGEPTLVTSATEDASKDQLVVATNAEFEPFEYTKGDKYLGVDMEIAALLAAELGKELVIKHMDFDSVCLAVGQGKCDIAMAGLTVSEEREEHVTFSEDYYTASQRIIVKSNDTTFANCKSAADIEAVLKNLDKNTKVGVQNGTTGQLYSEGDADWGFDGFPVTTVGYKNGSLAVQDMLNGNINFVIIDAGPAACITEKINALI